MCPQYPISIAKARFKSNIRTDSNADKLTSMERSEEPDALTTWPNPTPPPKSEPHQHSNSNSNAARDERGATTTMAA